jgi:3-hydroxyacyl-CoA dehydrogenase
MGTDACSNETIESLKKFTGDIDKKALVLPEKGAFILNKVFIYTQAQAFWACRDNILSFREIDELIKKHIFTMGTFEFLDHVGLDVILSAAKTYLEDMEHKDFIQITIEEVQKIVDKGNLGVKTGKGFYSYNKDEQQEGPVNLKQISDEERKKYEEEIVNKLICLYINLAYDYVDKGYCTESEIEFALNEYKGMEKGPVTLGSEIGFGRVNDLLMHYYQQTGEKVFYPSPLLRKRAEM